MIADQVIHTHMSTPKTKPHLKLFHDLVSRQDWMGLKNHIEKKLSHASRFMNNEFVRALETQNSDLAKVIIESFELDWRKNDLVDKCLNLPDAQLSECLLHLDHHKTQGVVVRQAMHLFLKKACLKENIHRLPIILSSPVAQKITLPSLELLDLGTRHHQQTPSSTPLSQEQERDLRSMVCSFVQPHMLIELRNVLRLTAGIRSLTQTTDLEKLVVLDYAELFKHWVPDFLSLSTDVLTKLLELAKSQEDPEMLSWSSLEAGQFSEWDDFLIRVEKKLLERSLNLSNDQAPSLPSRRL